MFTLAPEVRWTEEDVSIHERVLEYLHKLVEADHPEFGKEKQIQKDALHLLECLAVEKLDVEEDSPAENVVTPQFHHN